MKGTEPVKGKGMRNLFKQRSYNVFLINEKNTSKLCNHCHSELDKFHLKCHRKRKKGDNTEYSDVEKKSKVHGVLRCKSCKDKGPIESLIFSNKQFSDMELNKSWNDNKYYRVWNRDLNASLNILMKAKYIIQGLNIPESFN